MRGMQHHAPCSVMQSWGQTAGQAVAVCTHSVCLDRCVRHESREDEDGVCGHLSSLQGLMLVSDHVHWKV